MSLATLVPAIIRTHNGEDHSSPSAMPSMSSPDPMAGMSSSPSAMPSMADGSMSGMESGSSVSGMNMNDYVDILPLWVSIIWLVALAAVLVFHCGHLVRMGGQHRWFHSAHIVMLVGMLYMYAAMAFSWKWISGPVWVWLYALTTATILVWMIVRVAQKKPFSYLWILALVQQAAMIYMWMPMTTWVAWLSWGLVVYFTLETIAWLVGLCDDGKADRGNAVGPGDRSSVTALGHDGLMGNISMAIMAASMAYMFAAMQLMV